VAVALPFEDDRTGLRVTGGRVSGAVDVVPGAPGADDLLVVADAGGTTVLARLEPAAPGVAVTARPLLDVSREIGGVRADDATVLDIWELPDAGGIFAAAPVAVAVDALRTAEGALDATVAYVARHQFGRPVGSFQGGQARMCRHARPGPHGGRAPRRAVEAAVLGRPGSRWLWRPPISARWRCTRTSVPVLHGGIGYTWEAGVHRWLKRASLDRALCGSPAAHRRVAPGAGAQAPAKRAPSGGRDTLPMALRGSTSTTTTCSGTL